MERLVPRKILDEFVTIAMMMISLSWAEAETEEREANG